MSHLRVVPDTEAEPERLPFAHEAPFAMRQLPSGLEVPCDGPKLLALDDDGEPICAACRLPVRRTP